MRALGATQELATIARGHAARLAELAANASAERAALDELADWSAADNKERTNGYSAVLRLRPILTLRVIS